MTRIGLRIELTLYGPTYGQAGGDDVGLAAHADRLLGRAVLERHFVDRRNGPGRDSCHGVGRRALVERGAPQLRAHAVRRALQCREGRLLTRRPARLWLGQEGQRPVIHVVVERRLDVEDRDGGLDDLALAARAPVQLGLARVHERPGVPQGMHGVMGAERPVVAQPDRDRLVAAIHRHDLDTHRPARSDSAARFEARTASP